MLGPWSAAPDDFELAEYRERYAAALENEPTRWYARWTSWAGCTFREVRLDLGCGKGAFTVGSALAEPDVLFVGFDVDAVSIALAARLAVDNGARNVVFIAGADGDLPALFAPSELARIYLNFPTPYPKGRDAARRLTHSARLDTYRELLAVGGQLRLQTDNAALYRYSLGQLKDAGYIVLLSSEDARNDIAVPPTPETGYERRAVEMGARICVAYAVPHAAPDAVPHAAPHAVPGAVPHAAPDAAARAADCGSPSIASAERPTSLYDYLPVDIDPDDYVPPEMARAVAAIARTREQMRAKGTL